MKSRPFDAISNDRVRRVAKKILDDADSYHVEHAARLARTLELLCEEIEKIGPTIQVLELGTSGFLPAALKLLFPGVTIDVTNFDLSEKVEHQLKFEFSGVPIDVKAYAVNLESEFIPVRDGTYDIVVCCEVLEHMEVDPMFMLSEVNRVTIAGGSLLLTTPNVVSARGIAKMLSGYEPYFYMQYNITGEYHRHNYEYSVHSAYRLVRAAGFDAVVWTENLFEDPMDSYVEDLAKAGFNLYNTGDCILVIGRKISGVVDRYPGGLYV